MRPRWVPLEAVVLGLVRVEDRRRLRPAPEEFVGAAPGLFVAFLFLDSPYFPPDFPPEYAKYPPVDSNLSLLQVDSRENTRRMFNRSRNSVLLVDSVVGRIRGALERAGLGDRTIVAITGDHGREFGEHGFFGHGSAFTSEPTQVPFVLYPPGLPFREHTHRTNHHDLPATMLMLLGVDDPPARYNLGRNALEAVERPSAVSGGYRACALRDADGWLIFGIEGKTAHRFEVRDREHRKLRDGTGAVRRQAHQLAEIMRDMQRFFR